MLTLRAAAALLAAANSIETLLPIAAAVGCDGEPAPLDAESRRALGFGVEVIDVRVVAGPGALRALLLELRADLPMRELLARISARCASRAPHVLWLVVATQPGTAQVALVAWTGDRRPPQIAALVADRTRVVGSDAESLRALAAAAGQSDLLTHGRWVEVLGRDVLTRRFYRTLERVVAQIAASAGGVPTDVHGEVALLYVSRLLFLAFLEAKGWLDGDGGFLARQFDRCMATGGGFHRRVLRPLFFGTLNTPITRRAAAARALGRIPFLNGGLFNAAPVERRVRALAFSDESYGVLVHELFGSYRFTAREDGVAWSEAAVDPEMMGKAFESLMAAHERRSSGAYFTPQRLVDRVATAGLQQTLARAIGDRAAIALLGGEVLRDVDRDAARARLEQLTVLDPACGSGAFLVHLLERVADLHRCLGDARSVADVRRDVLTHSIFGVDVNPTAAWLCELRLWLSVVIDSDESDPLNVSPLPNLDHNIRVGDALAGRAFSAGETSRGGREIRKLRHRYASATGGRKKALARVLGRAERDNLVRDIDAELASIGGRRRELVDLRRSRDLFGERHTPTRDQRASAHGWRARAAELRVLRRRIVAGGALPFSFAAHFADVGARGGFDLVIGNPPWVRLHRVPPASRAAFRRQFVVARLAAWEPGAGSAGAGRGFAAQIDLAALFVERSLRLLAPRAAFALLVPVKLWRSLAAGGMRRLLATDADLQRIEDYSEAPAAFDAAVYPSLIVATRRGEPADEGDDAGVSVGMHHRGVSVVEWKVRRELIPFDETAGSPWITLPPDVRHAFDALRAAGQPLAASAIGRPHLGVKCGCNDAFVVRPSATTGSAVSVSARDGRSGLVERALLRPLIRGEDLAPWRVSAPDDAIIWTHDARDAVLRTLPVHAAHWLGQWKRQLAARSDARHATRWWRLFRVEAARVDRPRVVWADLGRTPRAAVLLAGDDIVPLNSCYVARCRDETDAFTLAALLNGSLAAAWLNALAG